MIIFSVNDILLSSRSIKDYKIIPTFISQGLKIIGPS